MTTTLPKAPGEYSLTAKLASEAFGSFLLIFGALGVALFSGTAAGAVPAPLAAGLALAAGIAAVGHVSGGHFNPAVTVGLAVAGRTNWRLVPGYLAAQLVGGLLGALLLWVTLRSLPGITDVAPIFSQLSNGFDQHSPNQFPLAAALLVEVVATAVFVAVALAVTSRRAVKGMAPWAVGLAYAVLVQALSPITNAGINPMRSTASAVFAEPTVIAQLWLFWGAPVLGGVLVGLIFRGFGPAEDLLFSSAGGAADATAEATRDDSGRAGAGAAAAAIAAASDAAGGTVVATDALAAVSDDDGAAGSAAAAPKAAPQELSAPGVRTAPDGDDDARDFFHRNR
ncbi:aquaporin [Sinomonas halotolerans]|uniref:Aquaporin n=1 Tax=Sinomonas halotolerans TaxID=1644133 RepID=A0ABU9WWU6_9MICC